MMTPTTDPDAPVLPAAAPLYSVRNGIWTISRHADVSAVLRSPSFRMASPHDRVARIADRARRDYRDLLILLDGTMLFRDGAFHQGHRNVVRGLVQRTMAQWTEPALRELARSIIDALPPSADPIDVVPALADPLPLRILAALLDIDPEDCHRWRAQAMAITRSWLPTMALRDLDDCQATAASLRVALPDTQSLGLMAFLLIAGADSVAGTISAALDWLARHPDWQDALRRDPALIPGFIRETMRLAGPIRRLTLRVALTSVEIGGTMIAAGDIVMLRTDSAHRDPVAFPDPDRMDPARKDAPLLAFGGGAHMCLGPLLGTMEAVVMVEAVLARFQLSPAPERGQLFDHEDWRIFERLPLRLLSL
ncbi:cytochrome P450 [Sphingobium sp. YR768]|uniref:cytochrome P450 n=1 Tax=Sphingobium sp. YR768 TaxID=1884365 RepID=UPI000B81288C|nr:cytochrome P450 [Sphingobium sp. YR768]